MKRLGTLCILVMSLVIAQSCGSSTPAPSGRTDSPAADPADGGGPIKRNVIWMTKNDGHPDTTVSAPCIGTASAYSIKVMRKQRVRWDVRNDDYNGCPNLTAADVTVVFANAILENPSNSAGAPVNQATYMGGQVRGRVHTSATVAPNGRQKYLVYYKGMKASPDPELDIDGDCGGCGPGGP